MERVYSYNPGAHTAFYDIQPGNAAGLFLQSWSLHRAATTEIHANYAIMIGFQHITAPNGRSCMILFR